MNYFVFKLMNPHLLDQTIKKRSIVFGFLIIQTKDMLLPRIKISVSMDISVLELYEYIRDI